MANGARARRLALNLFLVVALLINLLPGVALGAPTPTPTAAATPSATAKASLPPPTPAPSPSRAPAIATPTPTATFAPATPTVAPTSTPTVTPAVPAAGLVADGAGASLTLPGEGTLVVPSGALTGRARFGLSMGRSRSEAGLARLHPITDPFEISARAEPAGKAVTRLERALTLRLNLDRASVPKERLAKPEALLRTQKGWEAVGSAFDRATSTLSLELAELPAVVVVVDGAQEANPEGWDPTDPAGVQLGDGGWGVAYSDGANVLFRRSLPSQGPDYWLGAVTIETSADKPALVRLGDTLVAVYRKVSGTYRQAFVRTSTDYGATWSAPQQLTGETVDVYQVQAVIDGDTAYLFWSLSNSSRQLWYRTSTDLVNWSAASLVGRAIGSTVLSVDPSFDIERSPSGDWCLVWRDVSTVEDFPGAAYNASYPVAWFGSSPDLSSTNWANVHEATWPYSDAGSGGMSLAVAGGGTLYLGYTHGYRWDSYAYYRTSGDGGATWSERTIFGYEPSRPTDGWQDVWAGNTNLALDDAGAVRAFWDMSAGSVGGSDTYGAQVFWSDLPGGPITAVPAGAEVQSQLGNVCWSCYRADPVSTTTGNFTLPETDVAVSGRGLGVAFTRTYNSGRLVDGPLGYGWTHDYDTRLTVFAGGQVIIVDGSGRNDLYTPASGGGYTAPPGRFVTLAHNQDGSWTLTERNQVRQTFSPAGNLVSLADRNGNTVSLAYDENGRLSSITDPAGRALSFTYNGQRLASLTDALGRSVGYTYSPAGDLSTVTDVRGKVWTYTYDDAHRLLTKVDPHSHTVLANTYGSLGRVKNQKDAKNVETVFNYGVGVNSAVDPRGDSTTYQFDTLYRVTKIVDADGKEVYQYWDTANNLTRLRDQRKSVEENTYYTYDAYGNVLTRTNGLYNVWTYTYNAFNDVTTARDPLNHATTYGYDTPGNLTSVTNAKNEQTTFGYDAYGQLTSVSDARNKVTTFAYDTYGNQTTLTDPYDKIWTSTYDLAGRKTGVSDPLSHSASFDYDAAGNLLSATDGRDKTTTYAYDDAGNRTAVTDPNLKVTTYAYDEKNRLVSLTDAANGITTYAYDANDNLLSITDANNHARTWTYGKLNRVLSETDALGKVTTYEYDGAGNRAKRIDPMGAVTLYAYDTISRLTSVSFPTGYIVYAYNAANLRTSLTDATGATAYAYDELDRLTSVTQPGNRVVGYQYDAAGNRTRLAYPDNKVVDYAYDDANRMSTVTDWLNRVTSYTYDDAGRLVTTSLPNGVVETLAYNNANQLTSLAAARNGTTLTSFAYALDDAGVRAAVQDLAGSETYNYDDLYRLTGATYADNATQTYSYDAVGNRSGLSGVTYDDQGQPVPFDHTYAYDEADRLTAGAGATYTYDDNGNQASRTRGGATTYYCWDALNRLAETTDAAPCPTVLRINAGVGTYADTAGNQWSADWGYTGGSTLTSASAIAGTDDDALYQTERYGAFSYALPMPNGEYTLTLKFAELYCTSANCRKFNVAVEGATVLQDFDVFAAAGGRFIAHDRTFTVNVSDGVLNLQFSKVVADATVQGIQVVRNGVGSLSNTYSYRGDGLRGGKTEGGSTTTYTWDLNAGLPVVLRDGANTYVYGLGLISQTDDLGNQTYFLGDGLGSTRALTDAAGEVVATYDYDVFGAPRAGTGTGSTEYRFTGQQDDASLGYQYLRARYYDPATGRFISRDPFQGSVGTPGSLHRYAYGLNNPSNYADPTGKLAWVVAGALIGGALGAGTYAVTHWEQIQRGDVNWGEAAVYAGAGALAGSGVGAVAELLGGSVAVASGWGGAAPAVPLAASNWRQAEQAAGQFINQAKNTLQFQSPSLTANYRVPDFAGSLASGRPYIADCKYVQQLTTVTDQLRDYLELSRGSGGELYLFVRASTTMSDSFSNWVSSNGVQVLPFFR
ncbi:MAG: malectin domain-containing carbohydrate-binding protein [Chloroflexi bacterium]|nr:malectin domain-containing carbohydrate-binding protein [Chloroflexota bacterium]